MGWIRVEVAMQGFLHEYHKDTDFWADSQLEVTAEESGQPASIWMPE